MPSASPRIVPGRSATQLQEAQSDLTRALSRYSDLYQHFPLPYCTLDASGMIVDHNEAFATLLRRDRRGLVGRRFVRMVAVPDRSLFFGHMRGCRKEAKARTAMRLECAGERIGIELVSHAMPQGSEESECFHSGVIDLTEQRRAEEAGAASERKRRHGEAREAALKATGEARDRFLAELSHELRTPLTPILATVRSLRARDDVPGWIRGSLEIVQRNVEIEARLIDDLLDVGRIAADRMSFDLVPIDVHRTLREVVAHLASEIDQARIVCRVDLGARASWVLGEEIRLSQILWNLVVNALRNTPPLGEVVIMTSNIGDDLRISVRDNGVGIEPDRLEKIFSPFSKGGSAQSGKKGLGLGLSIVKGLVEAHKGWIHAFSAGKGEGASFVVDLPTVSPPAEVVVEPGREEAPKAGSGARVLLVEDHPDTRAALAAMLRIHGYAVNVAEDVPSALVAAEEDFDVLVCDIGLQNGSGLDVVRQLRERKPVKAIALSGYGSRRDVDLATEAGFAVHLTKPVGAEHLLEAIERLLGRKT